MATILENYDFIGGRRAKYPWAAWQDGQVWQVKRGTDFDTTPASLQAQLHGRAAATAMRVSTSVSGPVGAEDTVTFRFEPLVPGVECG